MDTSWRILFAPQEEMQLSYVLKLLEYTLIAPWKNQKGREMFASIWGYYCQTSKLFCPVSSNMIINYARDF